MVKNVDNFFWLKFLAMINRYLRVGIFLMCFKLHVSNLPALYPKKILPYKYNTTKRVESLVIQLFRVLFVLFFIVFLPF